MQHNCNHIMAYIYAAIMFPGLAWVWWTGYKEEKRIDRYNAAETEEEMAEFLAPGERYDPETHMIYPPEGSGLLPAYKGEMLH